MDSNSSTVNKTNKISSTLCKTMGSKILRATFQITTETKMCLRRITKTKVK